MIIKKMKIKIREYELKQNYRVKHFLLKYANVALLLSTISVCDTKLGK